MAEEVKKEATEAVDKAAGAAGDNPEVGKMKRGDYMIHVFIEQARQMKVPEGNTVDPMFEVSCMGVRKFTTAKDDISGVGLCTWNEHLFFEPKNVQTDEIEQGKISIRLLDKGYFKDALIGVYEFDIAYIYFMKQHSLMHRWLALSNPNSPNFNEVTGYLKLSITIAGSGDEQVQITEDTGADKSDQPIMMPPSIKPEFYQLRFKFFKAEKLPAMDVSLLGRGGSIDAYIICTYMSKKIRTAVKLQKEGGSLEWDQEFLIPCQLPIMSSRIVMKLYDQDTINDEIVGSLLFNIKDCIGPLNGKYFWKNVYGSPLGCSGDNTNLMNENPELASTWKGRILMSVSAEKTEKPQLIVEDLKPEQKQGAAPYLVDHEFEVIAEVGQGIGLPLSTTGIGALSVSSAEKYAVMIKIGDFELKSDKAVTVENNYNRWNFRFKQTTFKAPYQDISDIGQVFMYLMLGDKPICYYRSDIEKFTDPNPMYQWIQFLPDLALGKVTEPHKAGIVSVKLAIHDKTKDGPINFTDFDAWKKPPPKRLNNFKVRAFIFQCRDLPAADSDGQSDPYIRIWDTDKEQKKTQVIEDNLNPLFYETLELQFEGSKVEELPPFICDVYDYDMGPLDDDFIARSIIPIKECAYSTDSTVPRPKWHPCRIKAGAPPCGQILISFSIVDLDYNYATPLNYMRISETVETFEFNVTINILGLRNLQSAGILPVKKAFLQFNLKSLVPPDIGSALENLKTQPGDAGPNPTINTMIKFSLPLPTDPLFCPKLTCTVYDYIFKGISQPMIGSFIIPIGDCIHDLRKEREEETEAIKFIIREIDKVIIDMGAISYNVQEEIKEDFEGESIKSTSKVVAQILRQSMKNVDPELTKPLINSIMNASQDNQFKMMMDRTQRSASQPWTPSRVTPKHLMMQASPAGGAEKKVKANAMTMVNDFDKFGSGMKDQLLKETKEQAERAKREHEDLRLREQEEYRKLHPKAIKNVINPTYELDKRLNVFREVNPPPESLFMALGWDDKPEDNKRHYRRYYPDELENVKSIMPIASPFMTYEIKKGQSRGASSGWWPFKSAGKQDDSGEATTEQVVGTFKGIVTVQTHQDKHEYKELKADLIHQLKVKLNQLSLRKTQKPMELKLESLITQEGRSKFEESMRELGIDHLEISKHLADLYSDVLLERLLMCQTKCIVRVYMINAYDLASRDNGSFSDPYLKITLGNKTYDERSIYQEDEPNPEFNKHYDFEATFPGCPPLVIDVVDYDDIFGDDSIGKTIIDLEDRFFSDSWQSIKRKPIEFRQLYHPSSSVSQGVVKMWVEIIPTSIPVKEVPVYDLTPRSPSEFEVRLVIWDTLEVECMDVEGTSDVYCRAFFDSKEEVHETDTHYRCQNGKASFNYRLLYTVKHPRKDYNMSLQVYDRDFFKSNDIIGETIIDLSNLFEDVALTGKPLDLDKRYFNDYLKPKGAKYNFKDDKSFYVTIIGVDDKGETKETGKVRISIQILPKAQAEANKVGEARQEPNHSPFLPPPIGRLTFSLNPFKMFQQLVGPAMRRKIYCICCIVICVALCVALMPLILGNLISSLITRAF